MGSGCSREHGTTVSEPTVATTYEKDAPSLKKVDETTPATDEAAGDEIAKTEAAEAFSEWVKTITPRRTDDIFAENVHDHDATDAEPAAEAPLVEEEVEAEITAAEAEEPAAEREPVAEEEYAAEEEPTASMEEPAESPEGAVDTAVKHKTRGGGGGVAAAEAPEEAVSDAMEAVVSAVETTTSDALAEGGYASPRTAAGEEVEVAQQVEAQQESNETSVEEEAPAADVVQESNETSVEEEAPAADVVQESNETSVEEEAPAADVVQESNETSVEEEAPAADVIETEQDCPRGTWCAAGEVVAATASACPNTWDEAVEVESPRDEDLAAIIAQAEQEATALVSPRQEAVAEETVAADAAADKAVTEETAEADMEEVPGGAADTAIDSLEEKAGEDVDCDGEMLGPPAVEEWSAEGVGEAAAAEEEEETAAESAMTEEEAPAVPEKKTSYLGRLAAILSPRKKAASASFADAPVAYDDAAEPAEAEVETVAETAEPVAEEVETVTEEVETVPGQAKEGGETVDEADDADVPAEAEAVESTGAAVVEDAAEGALEAVASVAYVIEPNGTEERAAPRLPQPPAFSSSESMAAPGAAADEAPEEAEEETRPSVFEAEEVEAAKRKSSLDRELATLAADAKVYADAAWQRASMRSSRRSSARHSAHHSARHSAHHSARHSAHHSARHSACYTDETSEASEDEASAEPLPQPLSKIPSGVEAVAEEEGGVAQGAEVLPEGGAVDEGEPSLIRRFTSWLSPGLRCVPSQDTPRPAPPNIPRLSLA